MSDRVLLDVVIPGPPVGKGRPRAFRMGTGVRMFTPGKTRSWEADAAAAMHGAWAKAPLDGPCAVSVVAVAPRPKRLLRVKDPAGRMYRTAKPEGDNVLKCVGDALTKAGVVRDDALIVDWRCVSVYAAKDEGPSVWVRVLGVGALGEDRVILEPAPARPEDAREWLKPDGIISWHEDPRPVAAMARPFVDAGRGGSQ